MLLLTRIDSAEDAVSIDTMQLLRSVGNVWVTVNASSSILQQVNSKGSSFLDGRWVSLPLSSVSLSLGEAVDQLVVLLDKGASRVVLPASAPWLGEMLADPLLPPSRLAVHIIDASTSAAVAGLVAVAGGDRGAEIAIIVSINDGGGIAVFDEVLAAGMSQVWVDAAVDTTPLTYDFIKSIKSKGASTVIPWKSINMSNNKSSSSLLDLGRIVCECHLTTDRSDGLFTTIVKDEHGVALGLVYSSVESVSESIRLQQGVYQSRKKIGKELWYKGKTSGATQKLIQIDADCDGDCLSFTVNQTPPGFCHLGSRTCWGADSGITALASVLEHRKTSAPVGSYTARLFNDPALLRSKILEEANELVDAVNPDEIAWETADLIYFALTKCVANGVSLKQVEDHLDQRSRKVTRRPGNAKPAYMNGSITPTMTATSTTSTTSQPPTVPKPQLLSAKDDKLIRMSVYNMKKVDPATLTRLTHRPIMKTDEIMDRVQPILKSVRLHGDKAIRELTSKFDRIDFDESTSVVIKAPFPASMTASIPGKVKEAIDLAFENIRKFHAAQLPVDQDQVASVLRVETMPGVFCSRFVRPIENVGLYIPGGSAVLPSTALMLGVPAMVAGCKQIVFATPPRRNDTDICPVCPEVVYVAEKVGASMILMAGGAQAVAAMAYGTESVPKVDKICGPGNQYVTAAKMVVQNDSSALVSIDMPAGPSEVLVKIWRGAYTTVSLYIFIILPPL